MFKNIKRERIRDKIWRSWLTRIKENILNINKKEDITLHQNKNLKIIYIQIQLR